MQYYTENPRPESFVTAFEMLGVANNLGIKIFNPKISLKKHLLEMANKNAKEYVETSLEKIQMKREFTFGACEQLAIALGVENTLHKIECYDISHTAGEEQVASMTVFVDGSPMRKLYRRFKIKHEQGNNDFLSMQEVLRRRFMRLSSDDESFGTRPDLIIIDGGKGQLSSVMEVVSTLKEELATSGSVDDMGILARLLEIKFCSLAKQNEELFLPDNPISIVLSKRSYALRLCQRIRDEAHRFAITYHKLLRGKKMSPKKQK
jgi:excinuclease ABC subunit C